MRPSGQFGRFPLVYTCGSKKQRQKMTTILTLQFHFSHVWGIVAFLKTSENFHNNSNHSVSVEKKDDTHMALIMNLNVPVLSLLGDIFPSFPIISPC